MGLLDDLELFEPKAGRSKRGGLLQDLIPFDSSGARTDYTDLIVGASQRFNVPQELALRIHRFGEAYDPENPTSPRGATGPMQLMPETFKEVAGELGFKQPNINDPEQNSTAGVYYLRKLLDRFQDPRLAVAAYNAGPGAVEKHGGVPPYPETQSYVQRVLNLVSPSTAQAGEIPTRGGTQIPATEAGYELEVFKPGKRETLADIIPLTPSPLVTNITRGGVGFDEQQQQEPSGPTWWDTISKSIMNVPNIVGAEAGGMIKGISEASQGSSEYSPMQRLGEQLYQKYSQAAQEGQPQVESMSAKGLVSQAITGTGAIIPALVAGVVTGNPAVTATMMGLQSFGGAYPKQIEGGQTPEQAGVASMFSGFADAIPATIPIHMMLKPGMNFFKRLAATEITMPVSSMLSEALKMGIEQRTIHPDMTWAEARQRLVQAGLVAGITAPLMTSAAGVTRAAMENAPILKSQTGGVKIPGLRGVPETPLELSRVVTDPQVYRQKIVSEASKLVGESQAQQVGKYIDSINVEKLTTEAEVNQLMQAISERVRPAIQAQRRGKMSFEDIQEAANRSGLTEDKLMALGKGTALNAETGLAARMINAASADRVFRTRQKVLENAANGITDDQALIDFQRALAKHQMIQAAESGIATEAGRALSARRMLVGPEGQKQKNLKAMLDSLGGEKMTVEIAKKLAAIDPTDTYAVNRFIREAHKATTFDKLYEIWINALLSSPSTHAANIIGNALTTITRPFEKFGAATIEGVKGALTGKPRNRLFGEVAEEVIGASVGVPRGFKAAWQAFSTEMPSDQVGKLEVATGQQAIKGTTGRIVRLPGRFLMAADEFFKAINYSAEVHAQSFRQATLEGLEGQAKSNRMQQIINGEAGAVSERIFEAASDDAKYRTFQQDLSSFMRNVTQARNDPSVPGKLLRFIMPFAKTPVNVAKFGLERTPLGFLHVAMKAIQKDLKPGQAADEIARALMGSVVMSAIFGLALEGKVTGSAPKEKGQKDAFYRTGRQPYSMLIGDTWYSYQRFDPVSSIVGMAADFAQTFDHLSEEERVDYTGAMIRSISNLWVSKTWARGLSDMLDAIQEPEHKGIAWAASLAGTIIPTGVAAFGRAQDPYLRDVKRESGLDEFGARLQARIPGLAEKLPKQIDVFGEPVERAGSFVTRYLIPAPGSEAKKDFINEELYRLRELMALNPIPRKYKLHNREIQLTPEQYEELSILLGKEARKRLEGPMTTDAYSRMDDKRKADFIRDRVGDAREAIRSQYLRRISK